jgi:hypothetical protein
VVTGSAWAALAVVIGSAWIARAMWGARSKGW